MLLLTWSTPLVTLILCMFLQHSFADELNCIKGIYHKNKPSKETSEYKQCHAYKENTCCTSQFTADLAENRTTNLYNHTWDHCGQLSSKCLIFWMTQECFYQCSPYVFPWKDPDFAGGLKGVPVCSGFCDGWFEACKDELICVENVLSDFDYGEFGHNHCPKVNNSKECKTYKARYTDGKGLCEKMWGGSYKYTVENKDKSNCFQMDFSGKNPNYKVHNQYLKTKSAASSHSSLGFGILFIVFYVMN